MKTQTFSTVETVKTNLGELLDESNQVKKAIEEISSSIIQMVEQRSINKSKNTEVDLFFHVTANVREIEL